ncbi:peptidase T, partial [Brachyspira pilosicoli]
MLNDDIKKFQIDSFFKYSSIPSQSNASSKTLPSSEGQMKLAKVLAEDLKALGLINVVVNDNSIVTALLPKNKDNIHSIGFVAHLDTVDIGLTGDVHAQILKFEGNDLCLNKEKNIMFKVSEHPEIKNYINNDIIFSDGTSVLGADNKAAISTIMSALKYIKDNNIEHGDIYIAFVPDEEIGLLGSKQLDLNVFKPDFA